MSRTLYGRHANTKYGRAAAARFYRKQRKPRLPEAGMNHINFTARCPRCQNANYHVYSRGERTCSCCYLTFWVV
jgi:hypothetical protein